MCRHPRVVVVPSFLSLRVVGSGGSVCVFSVRSRHMLLDRNPGFIENEKNTFEKKGNKYAVADRGMAFWVLDLCVSIHVRTLQCVGWFIDLIRTD